MSLCHSLIAAASGGSSRREQVLSQAARLLLISGCRSAALCLSGDCARSPALSFRVRSQSRPLRGMRSFRWRLVTAVFLEGSSEGFCAASPAAASTAVSSGCRKPQCRGFDPGHAVAAFACRQNVDLKKMKMPARARNDVSNTAAEIHICPQMSLLDIFYYASSLSAPSSESPR